MVLVRNKAIQNLSLCSKDRHDVTYRFPQFLKPVSCSPDVTTKNIFVFFQSLLICYLKKKKLSSGFFLPHPESSFAGKKRTLLSYLTKIVGQNEICIKIHISLKHLPKVKVQVLTDIYSTRDKIQHINRCSFEY